VKTGAETLEGLLRQQEALRSVIESISGELALRPLLTRVVRSACELLGADKGTIGLVDEARNVVRTEAVFEMPLEEIGAEMASGVGLAGQVLATRAPVLLGRYGDADRPVYAEMSEDAVVGVPILWGERMVGFFGIGARPPRRFTDRDVEVLSLFARHAAIAIENARRYEREQRRTERLTLIARMGQIVTADLELSDLLQRAADAIHELLGYPYTSIALPDERGEPGALYFAAVAGGDPGAPTLNVRLPPGQGVVGAAARERRPILVPDVGADPRYVLTPGTSGIRSELAMPILLGDELLGVLNAESCEPLTEEDATGLRIVADQLAVAVENARLYAAMRRALDETRLLYRTSRRISTAMDVDEVVRAYLEQVAARAGGPYACSVALYERDAAGERTAVRVLGRWSPDTGIVLEPTVFPAARDALDPPLDAGQTVTIRDVRTDPRVSPMLRDIQRRSGRPALAFIPLIVHGARTGVVVLSHGRPHDWPEDDLHAFQATAAQLAAALESRRQQSLLFERGQQIAALEERHRIARDLHDSVTQVLFGMTLMAQSLPGACRRDPDEAERRADRLLELSRQALAEMRGLLAAWRSAEAAEAVTVGSALPAGGLVTALSRHIAAAGGGANEIEVCFDPRGWRPQTAEREEALYRIAQEALANALKHARGARRVAIRLYVARSGYAILRVRDDGAGFVAARRGAPSGRTDGGGMGLPGMRARAEALGGKLAVRSAVGRGTTVEARLPLQNPPIPV
jgi:GAF domain-containing protein/anti-sigma regulatory factor (Ser/Thr protein kinase)